MIIKLTLAEVAKIKQVVDSLNTETDKIQTALGGVPEEHNPSLTEFLKDCKFADVRVHFTGIALDIKPEFISDLCFVYRQYLEGTIEHVIPLVKSLFKVAEVQEAVMSKWS